MNNKTLLTLYLLALADRVEREADLIKNQADALWKALDPYIPDPATRKQMFGTIDTIGLENLEVELRDQIEILTGKTEEEEDDIALSFADLSNSVAKLEQEIKRLERR